MNSLNVSIDVYTIANELTHDRYFLAEFLYEIAYRATDIDNFIKSLVKEISETDDPDLLIEFLSDLVKQLEWNQLNA